MPEVKLVNITKTFSKGRILAVDRVSLQVHDKEYFSLVGPSGCGKTTTLRAIAGLVEPDEGDVYIDNKLVTSLPPEDRDIGYVFQQYALFPNMDVWRNVTYGPTVKAWDEGKRDRIGREMLQMVRLYERSNATPQELSGGMMQRVALARALAAGAELLLLDEPLGALDAKIRNELRYEIRRLVKDLGLTAIHVTHDQAEAMAISDRIAVMRKGRVVQIGTPLDLYMNPSEIFVANFIGESNFFEGRTVGVEGDATVIRLRGDLKVRTGKNGSSRKDERVVLAVRPEALVLAGERKKLVNEMEGVVEKVRFEGTDIRYEIRLTNDDSVVVIRPSIGMKWLKEGDNVRVGFPPEKSTLFAYPPQGLRAELELE
ncbi:MAG: ABC transporter ATP-binding protein [Candidatus Bathyarchaeota archaeon]|jgi:ABC-type Fe3+/spermidine/putrescine transport system ATPase subunit|nr:ABC transporter ATP-binding protein [Candidatus Bathyarchaeota archaeon]